MHESDTMDSQLERLEKISEKISDLVSSNDYEKINHLDRIRKKIMGDIQEKNFVLSTGNKETVLKLISKNQKIVSAFKLKSSESLQKILHKKNCSKAYLQNLN